MLTVRCTTCQTVFPTRERSAQASIRCPGCGTFHRLGALTSSTAGDSMMISPAALKQMLETPDPKEASRAYERPEPVILCPSCKVRLYINLKKYGGKRVTCPQCSKPMVVPRLAEPTPEVDEAEEQMEGET